MERRGIRMGGEGSERKGRGGWKDMWRKKGRKGGRRGMEGKEREKGKDKEG